MVEAYDDDGWGDQDGDDDGWGECEQQPQEEGEAQTLDNIADWGR